VLPTTVRINSELADLAVPVIHFGVATGELIGLFAEAGADVVGVDWRVPMASARDRTGGGVALQGNLDPVACVAGWDVARPAALAVMRDVTEAGIDGHIFNLGHGVMPQTDPDVLARLVDLVHSFRA